jgi:hypothetical protein
MDRRKRTMRDFEDWQAEHPSLKFAIAFRDFIAFEVPSGEAFE